MKQISLAKPNSKKTRSVFELGSVLYNIYTYLENYIRKMKTSNIYLIKTSKNLKKKFFNKNYIVECHARQEAV